MATVIAMVAMLAMAMVMRWQCNVDGDGAAAYGINDGGVRVAILSVMCDGHVEDGDHDGDDDTAGGDGEHEHGGGEVVVVVLAVAMPTRLAVYAARLARLVEAVGAMVAIR